MLYNSRFLLSQWNNTQNIKTQRKSYSTSYRKILRKDLRNNEPWDFLEEENEDMFKKALTKNMGWYHKVGPTDLRRAMLHSFTKHSPKYDMGGIKLGYIKILLSKANAIEDLAAVVEILSVVQNRDNSFVVDEQTTNLFCKAATRIKVPELGLTFLNMDWLNIVVSTNAVNHILNGFADVAETAYLRRAGLNKRPEFEQPKVIPEEDPEKPSEIPYSNFRRRHKREVKFGYLMQQAYNILRQEYNSHLEPNADTYSACIRYFASIGAIEQANIFWNALKEKSLSADGKAVEAMMLAHVWKEDFDTVLSEKFQDRPSRKALFAAHVAKGNEEEAKKVLELVIKDGIQPSFFNVHFGSEERITLIQSIAEQFEDLPENVSEHISELTAEPEDDDE
eukprot:TRINITY_DN4087_c0_g1_i1.p1 TRINITY_DN4087_c0_g1~~TRINITY_DN4087_c0_g1_i1.p1  ORF type:complete len:393 (-),score=108.42 TRINITY_DN4087_c0_g1_i1:44-1222(-)